MTATQIQLPSRTVGQDIRALRKARGLTLNDLAARVGRSVGWMSQVERDISKPSIDELRRLAAALEVSLSLFFGQAAADEREQGRIVRKAARRQCGQREQGLTEEWLSPDLTDDFEMFHSTFLSGAEMAEFITRPTQEVGYLVSGRLKLFLGADEFDLNPGDSFRIRREPYRWANPYSKEARAVWVIAPPVY